MITSEVNVGSATNGRETHHSTHVMKMHHQRDLLIDGCVNAIEMNSEVNQLQNNHNSNLILVIQFNTVVLKQNEPQDMPIIQFILKFRLEFNRYPSG